VRLSLFVGVALVFFSRYFKKNVLLQSLILSFLAVIILFLLFPSISLSYNIERLYQVALIILVIPLITGLLAIAGSAKRFIKTTTIAIFVISTYLLYNSGLLTQIGGGSPSAILNNDGYYYDQNVTTAEDALGAQWLGKNDSGSPVNSDVGVSRAIQANGDIYNIKESLLPVAIKQNSFVFLSSANLQHNIAFATSNLWYIPPINYISNNKNKVYANQSSYIYK
jgi:uncharacterized membrane protein